ncbi:MAG: hypothetical protein QNK37_36995 [Acidobacteriota bacterium]|nr:hypothetical protein [Acidobacteriota bacterium]
MAISFENDIMPFFAQYKGQMGWRLDLTNYEDVKANAELILGRIDPASDDRMPPPPFPPFSDQLFINFNKWIDEGCPP